MDCHFERTEAGWRCLRCGWTYCRPRADAPRRNCPRAARAARFTEQPSRGLGDTIARLTRWLGIKPCDGCKRRQAALNRWFPYQ